jgi:hypothetical protein
MKLDVEQSLKQLIAGLLTLRAKCSLLALKPAMSSPYLPVPPLGELYLVIVLFLGYLHGHGGQSSPDFSPAGEGTAAMTGWHV